MQALLKNDDIDINDSYDATDNVADDGTDKDVDNAIDKNVVDDATDNNDDNQIRRLTD